MADVRRFGVLHGTVVYEPGNDEGWLVHYEDYAALRAELDAVYSEKRLWKATANLLHSVRTRLAAENDGLLAELRAVRDALADYDAARVGIQETVVRVRRALEVRDE